MTKWESTKNVAKIRSLLGLAGYYRRFVKDFSKVARPITVLMRKETRFRWDESYETAFQTLKEHLTTTPILALPEESENLKVYTNVSKNGLDCVLMQNWKDEMSKMGIHIILKGDAIGDLTIEPDLYDDIKRKQELDHKIQDDADLKSLIMTEAHCTPYSVHLGGDKLYMDLKKTFWWSNMKNDVAECVAKCLTCKRVKGEKRRPQGKIQSLEVPEWK
ncbi:uncharacterized protein LOC141620752 [Silene latifolia]|uniref:uncharacterized protein LOC141620752 n=1 Tax=Silene latifolia TaxID=37657 RepID=UPI003D78A929